MLVKFIICIFICFSFCFGLYAVVYDSSKPKEETYEEKMRKKGLKPLNACPHCHSTNIRIVIEQEKHPAETEQKLKLNLSPLEPFTIFDVKEKIVKPEYTTKKSYWKCCQCGETFQNPYTHYVKMNK